jgi:4-hydroxythreonine-4-phosphate dehydrogenase
MTQPPNAPAETGLPRLALVQGDATGIGPELMAKLLDNAALRESAQIVIFSDARVFRRGCEVAGIEHSPHVVTRFDDVDFSREPVNLLDLESLDPDAITPGEVSAEAGASVLRCYGEALDRCRDGSLDGLCFMPFNKGALHLAGMQTEDETQWAKQRIGHAGRVSEFNVIDGMWNARVTSHIPIREVADALDVESIVGAVQLADKTLREAGFSRPRIAVAALNPHAGDGGAIGREEIEIITPAVQAARELQLDCEGPFPSDTLYIKVRDGEYDCAVSMYHDQGQIAIKLLGFQMGVSVLSGLPFPMATPAHGTAFDIVGQNIANIEPSRRAFAMVARMAQHRIDNRA